VDFSGTDWDFLESPGFLLAVFALGVVWYAAERSGPNRMLELTAAAIGLALGGLLFAGSLAEGGSEAWPGIFAGVACGALAWTAVGGLLERTRGRLAAQERRSGPNARNVGSGANGGPSASLLTAYAEGAALVLAAAAIFLPPVSFLALAAFVVLLVRGRREGERKYAGLRVLR
jgi:hypothetical protein